MRYKLFGQSGLRVSELCLGTMTFGEDWGWGAGKAEARRIFDAFCGAGGNFIDTANVYTNGTSEALLKELIASERDSLVIATKYACSTRRGDPNAAGAHRKNLVRALDASLRRLGTEYVDVYWVHLWDFLTHVDEVMRALDDQVRAGKVLYIGVSDAPAWVIAQANVTALWRGWTAFVGVQAEYSLIERSVEREIVPMARSLGLGLTAWSPLGAGLLTGKYQVRAAGGSDSGTGRLDKISFDRRSPRNLQIADAVSGLARELGKSPAQVALNWLRARQSQVIPIVGAREADQLQDNLACLEWQLEPSALERLDAASSIELGFPSEMIAHASDFVYGGTFDQIDGARQRIPIEISAPGRS